MPSASKRTPPNAGNGNKTFVASDLKQQARRDGGPVVFYRASGSDYLCIMATHITTPLSADSLTPTSSIESIRATTEATSLDVILTAEPEGAAVVLFHSRLYAFDNVVSLSDVAPMLELYMQQAGVSVAVFRIQFDTATATFRAFYCTVEMDLDFIPEDELWSRATAVNVHPDSSFSIACLGNGSESFRLKAVGRLADGRLASLRTDYPCLMTGNTAGFAVSQIRAAVSAVNADGEASPIVSLLYFSLSRGHGQKFFYLSSDHDYLVFRFRNCFNVLETLEVVGTVNRKQQVKTSDAMIAGRLRQYDRTTERLYEVVTGALSPSEAAMIEEMAASHFVEICGEHDDYRILITDSSCESSNDDATLTSHKFTFRFDGMRPTLFGSDLDAFRHSGSRIFTDEYSEEFS